MPFTIHQEESGRVIECAGECGVNSAGELKALLSEALSSADELRVGFDPAGEIDITVLQLLWAAARQADQTGRRFLCAPSDQARMAAREAGLDCFPEEAGEAQTIEWKRMTDGEDDSHRG